MLPRHHPDRIRIAFDDHRLVANAGLILPATLAPCASACPNSSSSAGRPSPRAQPAIPLTHRLHRPRCH